MSFSFYIADPVVDREVILKLWKNNIQSDDFDRRYEWLYFENPVGPMRTVLAVHDETAEIIGAGSFYPQKVILFGKPFIFGTAADYMVDKRYRVFGPALQIQRKLLESSANFGFDYLLAYPGRAAKGVINYIGYEQIGFVHRYVKILKSQSTLAVKIKPAIFLLIVSCLIDSYFRLEDFLKSLFLKLKYECNTDVKSKHISLDFPWSDETTIILDKSQTKMTWRYMADENRFFSITSKSDSQSKAYIVYLIDNKIVFIIDVVSTSHMLLLPLLRLFIQEMHRLNNQRINMQFLGDTRMLGLLKKLRFYVRKSDRACYLAFNSKKSAEFKRKILDENRWFIFESDMDI